MEDLRRLVIGTRGSRLALVQTELVAAALKRANPQIEVETKIITTKGDVNQSPIPLDTVGKAWFTEEIEQAIVAGEIDIAVHSLKDVPPELPSGLVIIPVLERADAADVLVSKSGTLLKDLKHGATVGTDSVRRKALLLAERPDLIVKSIRGNVDTRLKKLETEDYDAVVLAEAGLSRLGMADRVTERFDPTVFIPAPGQAILAVEIKSERVDLFALVKSIAHAPTTAAAEIEQVFSSVIGGGCKLPIGCYAKITAEAKGSGVPPHIEICAVVGTMDGARIVRRSKQGNLADGKKLAEALAQEFLNDPIYAELEK